MCVLGLNSIGRQMYGNPRNDVGDAETDVYGLQHCSPNSDDEEILDWLPVTPDRVLQ